MAARHRRWRGSWSAAACRLPAPAVTALLEIEALQKRFPVGRGGGLFVRGRASFLHAVEDVSFALAAGETLGLVGESGCGKSTLARLIARLLDPSASPIRLAGQEIGTISDRRAAIQILFQDADGSINPRHMAFETIARPPRRLAELSGAALGAKAEAAAVLCGLSAELLGRFRHQLSGGQKARVGMARAIATEPLLLVLDEPTSALDVSVQVVVLDLLRSLQARTGAAYVFVSHDLNVVRLLCDRVLVMYVGRVVEEGPVETLFEAPAHPCTQARVGVVSARGRRNGEARVRLAGEPRSQIDPNPNACRFHGRCPIGQDIRARAAPTVNDLGDRRIACPFPLSLGASAAA
jgi:oligopeptide/dipeptide ABC transporter ATP-binding protein